MLEKKKLAMLYHIKSQVFTQLKYFPNMLEIKINLFTLLSAISVKVYIR